MLSLLAERLIRSLEYNPSLRATIKAICLTPGTLPNERVSYDDRSIQVWVNRTTAQGGLRLVSGANDGNPQEIPFSESTFRAILKEYELPVSYLIALPSRVSQYGFIEWKNDRSQELLSFVTKAVFRKGDIHCLALTYNAENKTTSALLHRSMDAKFDHKERVLGHETAHIRMERLIRHLENDMDLASHPGLILLALFFYENEGIEAGFRARHEDMKRLAKSIGQGILFGKREEKEERVRQMPDTLRTLNRLHARITSHVERMGFYLRRHKYFLNFMDKVETVNCAPEWKSHTQQFRQEAEFLAAGWEEMLSVYQSHEKYLDLQLKVMENTTIQHDNSMMKSMTFLTMLFLPATYISTLFAIPMFNWDAHRAPDILTTYAWIYPAVAGPLTILVLSLWFGWIKVSFIFDRLQLRTSDGLRRNLLVELRLAFGEG